MTRDHWKERRAKLRFLLSRKSPSLQYCRYLLYTVAAIFRGKPPYYQKLPPLLCGLPRTVSAKTTPIKVDDLNRGAYGRDGRATETSNTPYDPAKRLEIFRRTPPTIPSFPLRSSPTESNDYDDGGEQFHSS